MMEEPVAVPLSVDLYATRYHLTYPQVKRLLDLGIKEIPPEAVPCRSCAIPIVFQRMVSGSLNPIAVHTGRSHFADCPEAKTWRQGKRVRHR